MALQAGHTGRVEHEVTGADTAVALGSGDVPVLATPRVLALLEAATVRAVADALAPGETTVGVDVRLAHRAATAVGHRVLAEAELVAVDGRALTFDVRLTEGGAVLAEGRVRRALVDRERFLSRLG